MFSPSKRRDIRGKYGLNDKYVIGMIGRLEKVKNHIFMLNVMKELKDKPDILLLIVGMGSENKTIEDYIMNNKMENQVEILNYIESIEDIYCAIDLFVMPSLYEGHPISFLEAQINGIKCIVSRNIGSDSIINPGITQCDLDVGKWTDEVLRYYMEYGSVYCRDINMENVKQLSINNISKKICDIYETL